MIPANIAPWTFFACVAPPNKWSGVIQISEVVVRKNEEGKLVPVETLKKEWKGHG